MIEKYDSIFNRYKYVEERLSDPSIASDQKVSQKLNKEYKQLQILVDAFEEYKRTLGSIETADLMLRDGDEEMNALAKEELPVLELQKEKQEEGLKLLLIPKDPEDEKDVVLEIRAGTGGDEASIFAGDLYRMYDRYFESMGWKTEIITLNEGTSGGYKEIVMEISGDEVYGTLKFESGAHRVQRVPETEAKSRVHTSAATVAVIPRFEVDEIDIRKEDLRIDVFRSSGAGGQHVNRTESAVRMTHLPTGIVAESQEARSQIKNREIALNRLYQKLQEAQAQQIQSSVSQQRKSLVGSGDRSEKIRTYNFPQNRVTDHRINLTLYALNKIITGDIGPIIEALRLAENERKLTEAEMNV